MKLSELFKKAGEPRLSRDFKSLAELNKSDDDLKAQIEGGKIPSIRNAGYSIHGYAWGDFTNYKIIDKNDETFFKYNPIKKFKKNSIKKVSSENPFKILKNLNLG